MLHILAQLFSDFSPLVEEHSSYYLKRRCFQCTTNEVQEQFLYASPPISRTGFSGHTTQRKKTHCDECMALDRCWFSVDSHPTCPHHPYCHCTLEPIEYALVIANTAALSDYTKYDPYLFDPANFYKYGKNKAFESWGYTIADSQWLKDEIERQAREKYARGDYPLGILNTYGQHINIRIEVPRKDGIGKVSIITGWTVYPNGQIKLNTPYREM